ncbi:MULTISPECIES: PPOX class F420-dependent oxidoreductase [Salinibaculum]|uniref:PPOX class F420-dependent oxidoreductase n=1 Tax=Salinibaculum TaxID=2732368 RepID=UPI0030D5A851
MTQIPPDARDLVDRPTFAHFATMLPNGMPHVTPTWVDADDDYEHVLVNTARTRRKERNVRKNPHVGMSIIDPDDPYRYLSLWGSVVELTEDGAREHIDELAGQYMGVDRYPNYDSDPGERVIVRIRPEHVTTNG